LRVIFSNYVDEAQSNTINYLKSQIHM